jgi:hypothetical protein
MAITFTKSNITTNYKKAFVTHYAEELSTESSNENDRILNQAKYES